MLEGSGPFGPYTSVEVFAVTIAALLSAVALAVVADPVAGIVWLLMTAPGVYVVARSMRLARATATQRTNERTIHRIDDRD